MEFVFDTYALIEIIRGNKNYLPYLEHKMIINNFIFAEICYVFFRNNFPNPEKILSKYTKYLVSIKPDVIRDAMEFRLKNKKKKLSMTDCISYFMARDLGIKFLTGDKEFEDFEGVEFVK
ncbi:PIN domain-containing protein [Candidatus Pacearchaeota archaeon]|nr:PIN domain-containing protein [Candidatus Pacearchaeota archaeon]